jgi:uncharacterized protein
MNQRFALCHHGCGGLPLPCRAVVTDRDLTARRRSLLTLRMPKDDYWRCLPCGRIEESFRKHVKKEGSMLLQSLLVPTYVQMLGALSAWLGKIDLDMVREEVVLTARLVPDMFPLSTQISFACVQAQEGVYRLRQEPLPLSVNALLDEGRSAAERPGSIADALAKISATIELVKAAAADAHDIDPLTPIAYELPQGMIFDLTAEQYVRDWALPQFYFHVMTAYAILRSQRIELGKADYVAHMFAYLRRGTAPS